MSLPLTEIIITRLGVEMVRHTVAPGEYVFGGGDDADILVECGGISPRHALLTVNFSELFIESLDFKNCLLVNGRPVGKCVRLWPHQVVTMGEATIEVRRVKVEDHDPSLAPQAATVHQALPDEFLREHRYEIGSLVAEGGMGAILTAHEAVTGRTVAMKVMLSSLQPSTLSRFIREAQITSQLEHPNIVPLHELGVDEDEQVFYTMKLVEGITLKQVLHIVKHGTPEERAKYSLPQLLIIFQKVCDAIGFAHSRGVVHRDLKPDNIMVGEYGEVLAMDWGLAKILWDSTALPRDAFENLDADPADDMGLNGTATMAGMVVGTPQYMPPEQACGDIDAQDERSDIYSLGAILYQILALCPPVHGDTPDEVLRKVLAGQIEPLRNVRTPSYWPIPESLAAVAMKALAMNPADRYGSVQELQADIAAYQAGFATAAERAGLAKQLFLLVRRHRWEATILVAGLGALLAVGAFALANVTRERGAATRARENAEAERSRAEDARSHAVAERARAEIERNRANEALAELRKAAPAFQGQAGTLVEEQKFDDALEKNRLAIELAPEQPSYHLFRAHTLAAMQRLPEAVKSYQRALELKPDDRIAKTNLELCERLVAEAAGKPLNQSQQTQLLEAILAQKRIADSIPLSKALGRETEVARALIQIRLKSLVQQEKWNDGRLKIRPDRTFALDLSDLVVPDLSVLRGLPIAALTLGRGNVTDLAPLAGLPLVDLDCSRNPVSNLAAVRDLSLERLNISETKVTDLTPLARMPLRQLTMNFTAAVDLRPLRGLPLQTLRIAGLPIRSIETLAGLRLRELDLFACRHLADVSALISLVELQSLNLPSHINDLTFVQQLRSLRRLGNSGVVADAADFAKLPTVAQFFATEGQRLAREKQFGPRLETLRNLLRKLGAPESKIAEVVLDDRGFMNLDLSGVALTNLSPLAGLPIRNLIIRRTGAADLAPLSGMRLVSLDASENPLSNLAALASCHDLKVLDVRSTSVADLRPLGRLKLDRLMLGRTLVQDLASLRGMPLVELDLSDCPNVRDLAPLIGCTRLETLLVPAKAADAATLRQLASLKRLSTKPLAGFEGNWATVPAVSQFRFASASSPTSTDLEPLRAELRRLGMPENKVSAIRLLGDGVIDLDLRNLPIEDLTFLKGLPIRSLNLDGLPISDLSPLAGAPIQRIEMRGTRVGSLEPLRGAPLDFMEAYSAPISDLSPLSECQTLRSLRITGTQVSDLTPVLHLPLRVLHIKNTRVLDVSSIANCTTLEVIELTQNAPGTNALRKLPQLRRISSRYDRTANQVAQTAGEFWAEFDSQANTGKQPGDDLQAHPSAITIDQLGALVERAETRLRYGRLKEAAADFKRAAELDPVPWRFLTAAPLLVHTGDLAGYRKLSQQGLELFHESGDMEACERIAKMSLLLATSASNVGAASKLADTALSLGADNDSFLQWAQMTKALADYRAGQYAAAIEWVQKSLAHENAAGSSKATAYAILAMAEQKSRHLAEAQAALAEAAQLVGDIFAQPEGTASNLGDGAWHDWLIARIILREAQAEVERAPSRKAGP